MSFQYVLITWGMSCQCAYCSYLFFTWRDLLTGILLLLEGVGFPALRPCELASQMSAKERAPAFGCLASIQYLAYVNGLNSQRNDLILLGYSYTPHTHTHN